jgi:predicted PurR-regulated permease PerM
MELHHQYKKIVPFIFFTLALVLLFMLVRPMIVILLSSVLLAYVTFPLYKKINKKITNQSSSIILALLIIVIIILIPFFILAALILQQGFYFHNSLSSSIEQGVVFGFGCTGADSKLCLIINDIEKLSSEQSSTFGIEGQLQKFLPFLKSKMIDFIQSLPLMVAQIFLTLVITFFILKEWKSILNSIVELLPMRKKTIDRLIHQFGDITHTVLYAQLFVALVQGLVGIIGFYIFGVPFPILLGLLMAFCALLPAIGTAIIWLPASIFLILSGYFSSNYWMLGKGIGLFFYGLLIISTIDNFLLATIVRVKAKINQIIIIVGVIGGASLFGIMGIFIGPILLPLLITYFETFKERFK